MPLIGTAGHVDHGKSSLIQRLTGRDPDRWAEEKRRGLTIDLGFAWMTLPGGAEVSFVDVPGHERYLKNMLAGIEAIDAALFVVAADEGWMPQSEEHLAVLDLLEVESGVVALTKTDLVDTDLLELATIEVSDKLGDTSLESAIVCPVSARTGDGVDDLIAVLDGLATQARPQDRGRPRLWVDRSFSATGSGTVVTGSLLDGHLTLDDEVRIYPGQAVARVRGIQSHETQVEEIGPGRRVALNLAGVNRDDVRRGDMVALPGQWETSNRFLGSLGTARYVDGFERRGAYQLHIGSAAHGMHVTGVSPHAVVIQTDNPIPLTYGDKFIIRDTGRQLVVAGGSVLDPAPGPTSATLGRAKSLITVENADQAADAILDSRGSESLSRLENHTHGGTPGAAIIHGGAAYSRREASRLEEQIREMVVQAHSDHPLRVGLPLATLATAVGIEVDTAEALVEADGTLQRHGPDVAVAERQVALDPASEEAWNLAYARLEAGLGVPTIGELGLDPEILHLKVRAGELASVGNEFVFLPAQIETIKSHLRRMEGDFTVADFRDATGLSRKYAVPILEWADKEGLTVRRGDTRRVR